jgi:hypothetical protein
VRRLDVGEEGEWEIRGEGDAVPGPVGWLVFGKGYIRESGLVHVWVDLDEWAVYG